ncbi:MAG: hypothetical protein MJ252_30165, partial [archaeon]|nr:hypothetical protein [archaeon]
MKSDMNDYDKLSKAKKELSATNYSTAGVSEKGEAETKVDPTEKRDLARLVDYYRLLLDTFEKERVDYSNRLEQLKIKNEEEHKLDWETKRRKDEIIELEQALYEASIALSNERKRAIHFANEIENCKLRKKEDHRRIVQLLQLAEPIEQTIKLYQGKKPEKTEKYSNFNFESGIEEFKENSNNVSIKRALSNKNKIKRKLSKGKNKYGNFGTETGTKKPLYRIPPSDEKQQILRTIMLPNDEKTVEQTNENESLKREIEDIKNKYDDQILKLEENRKLREEEFRQKCLDYNKESEDILKEIQRLEKLNHEITKDMMELKYDNGLKEKKVYEEMEVTKLNNRALENNLNDAIAKGRQEKIHSLSEYNKKTREITANLRGQVRVQTESANIIKEQYNQIQKIYTSKVKNLKNQLTGITEKCKLMEERKNFNIEGYINEIKLMRKRLQTYQDYVRKIMLQVEKMAAKSIEENKGEEPNNELKYSGEEEGNEEEGYNEEEGENEAEM